MTVLDEAGGRVLDGARLCEGDDVLDLAAATGLLTFGAHERIGDGWVHAVAADPAALEELLRCAHELDVAGIAYLVGDVDVLPLPDASVDAVVGVSALAAAADLAGAARELHRVLRPSGRLSLYEPGAEELGHRAAAQSDGEAADRDRLAGALRGAGFAEVAVVVEREQAGAWVTAARR